MKGSVKFLKLIRPAALAIILIGSVAIHYAHLNRGVRYPSVHAICPFGGLENLWAWLSAQANVQKIFSGTMSLFFLTVGMALLLKRSFCGNICPFGALQDFFSWAARRLGLAKARIPAGVDRGLSLTKYAILALSITLAWLTASLWISPYDPWAAFAHITKGSEMLKEFPVGTALLAITIVASLFVGRAFCKYLCPAGALYALVGKLSPYKIKVDPEACVRCGACDEACPMGIRVHEVAEASGLECISCSKCVSACPDPKTMISMKWAGKRLGPSAFLALSLGLFFGALFVLDATGLYAVSLPTPQEVVDSRQYVGIADLRGSMSVEQGAFYTGMDLADFRRLMEIPERVPADTLLKEISLSIPGYDFHRMKATKRKE
jgi:polyferredoxin